MTPFPLPLSEIFGHWGSYVVYALIGLAFGYVLEISGFGNSKKLAAQFYFKDMTVLKVMFGAIIVAMVLVFGAAAIGLLDYNLIWVNPTYLWPGIVGGLIMGFGFIIGGFCPGTSLVSMATGKIDGIFFVLGVFFGIFMFGETVQYFEEFWYSSFMGRYTLPQLFDLPVGVVVLGVVLMALFMFFMAEKFEAKYGDMDPNDAPKWRYFAAAGIALFGVVLIVIGQPTVADRWARVAEERQAQLDEGEVQIHPAELLDKLHDRKLKVHMLDVRSEADYNLFHILDAQRAEVEEMEALAPSLIEQPANTLFVVMSNDEAAATEAWKVLIAESVPNVYILEGGINNWIDTYAADEFKVACEICADNDKLRYDFTAALGAQYLASEPNPHDFHIEYIPKVKMELKRAPSSGGCG